MNPTTADPLAFVNDALEIMPDDAAQTTLAEFPRLADIGAGIERHQVRIGAQVAALDYRLRHGERRMDVLDELVRLEAFVRTPLRARRRGRLALASLGSRWKRGEDLSGKVRSCAFELRQRDH
jgi:hypothetical protein